MNPVGHAVGTVPMPSHGDRARGMSRTPESGGAPNASTMVDRSVVLACLLSVGSGCGIYGGWRGSLLRGIGRWKSTEIAAGLRVWHARAAAGRRPRSSRSSRRLLRDSSGLLLDFQARSPDEPAGCRSVAACHARGEFSSHPAEKGQGVCFAHGRFHPVPTRPVFTPWICPQPAPAIGGVQPEPSVPRIAPMPEPRSEIIPTPPE